MYEIDSRSAYYDIVETIADSAREHDPSAPKHVAEHCIQSTVIVGDEIALNLSAQPYAMDRLRPSHVIQYSRVGTRERTLGPGEARAFGEMSFREQAVACLERDLIEVATYQPE